MKKNTGEVEKIIELIARLNSNVAKDHSLTHVSDEQYDRILDGVKKLTINIYNHKLVSPASHDRLDELTDIMTSLAALDFSKRADVEGSENHLDYIAIGLNLLSYQLAKQVEPMKILKAYFEMIKEPIIAADSKGRVLLINNSLQFILGADNTAVYQVPVSEIIESESSLSNSEYDVVKAQLKTQRGELIPLTFTVYQLKNQEDKILGYVYKGVLNVGDKNAEGEAGSIAALEEKNPLDFNRIHHDISGPIKSMKGAISLGRINADNKETLKLFEIIEKCRQMIEGHFADLFDMIFIKSSKIFYENVSPEKIAKSVISTFTIDEENTKTSFNVSADPDVVIRSNKKLIHSILHNLISNALKYANQKSEHPYVGLRITKTSNGGCIVEVSDNGIGIKPENLEAVFKPHFRASEQAAGKGLGLYIVQQAVEKLGGNIQVQSKYGEGSVFKINLPDIK